MNVGDSIAFDSTQSHRLFKKGDVLFKKGDVQVIAEIVDRL